MADTWNEIDAPPPTPKQRQACYKFSLPRHLVHNLTPSEASAIIDVLGRMARRQAAAWQDRAQSADDLLT